jgi:hypothetical protein
MGGRWALLHARGPPDFTGAIFMSTGNIVSVEPTQAGVMVTFQTHRGEVSYLYTDPAAVADILNGGDPAQYTGTRV